MYPNLKLQLWKLGVRQNRLAQMIGIHETLLSKIVNGFRVPDADCRMRIAQALESNEEWLFATNDTVLDRLHSAPKAITVPKKANKPKRQFPSPGDGSADPSRKHPQLQAWPGDGTVL